MLEHKCARKNDGRKELILLLIVRMDNEIVDMSHDIIKVCFGNEPDIAHF